MKREIVDEVSGKMECLSLAEGLVRCVWEVLAGRYRTMRGGWV